MGGACPRKSNDMRLESISGGAEALTSLIQSAFLERVAVKYNCRAKQGNMVDMLAEIVTKNTEERKMNAENCSADIGAIEKDFNVLISSEESKADGEHTAAKDAETKRMSDADTTHNKIVSKHEQRVANAKSEIGPKTKEVQVHKEALDKRQAELDDEAVVVKADQKSVDERHVRSIGGAEKRRDQAKEVADKEKKITETESNRMYLKSKSECKKDKENREKLVASDRKLIEEIRPLLESLTRCKGGKAAGRTSAKHTHAKESMLLEVQAQTEVACAANAFIEFPKFGPDTKVRMASAHVELMSLLDMYDPASARSEKKNSKSTEKKPPLSEVTGTYSNWEDRVQQEEKHTASVYDSCHGEAQATLKSENSDAQTVHDKQDEDANANYAATIDKAEKEKANKDQHLKERLEAKVEPRDEANQEWKNAQLEKKRAEEVVQEEEKEEKEALKQSTQVRENEKKAATLDRQDKDKTIKLKLDGEKQRAARER